jgi:hypothetical protein
MIALSSSAAHSIQGAELESTEASTQKNQGFPNKFKFSMVAPPYGPAVNLEFPPSVYMSKAYLMD